MINVSAIARDAAVARPTVQGYFDILVDTLVGVWLPAWRPRAKVKEVAHPKFYFFDPGAVRALAGRSREPLDREERGPLLETYVLHELRAWMNRSGTGGQLAPSRSEVDFIGAAVRHGSASRSRRPDIDDEETARRSRRSSARRSCNARTACTWAANASARAASSCCRCRPS